MASLRSPTYSAQATRLRHAINHSALHYQPIPVSVLNGSGRPSLAPGRPRPDPEGQVKYGSGQRGPAVGQAGGRERWRFFRPPLTWADLGPALDPEIRKRVVNLQKITLKSFISWGRVKFCVELCFKTALKVLDASSVVRAQDTLHIYSCSALGCRN